MYGKNLIKIEILSLLGLMATTNGVFTEAWYGMDTLISQGLEHKASRTAFTESEDWIC